MLWILRLALVLAAAPLLVAPLVSAEADPTPPTLDAFKAAAARIVEDAGLPGAGIALGADRRRGMGGRRRRRRP